MLRTRRCLLVSLLIAALTAAAMAVLAFVIYFIVREALPTVAGGGLGELVLGRLWLPIDLLGPTFSGILNFLPATIYVSVVGMALALLVGLGAALYLSCQASDRVRGYLYPVIDLLAGIPSVIYGFIGLVTLVRLFMRAGVSTGSCVLAAGVLLAVMLLPFLVSSCSETMLAARRNYLPASQALGVSKWYAAAAVILPASWKNILLAMVLAIGRAMGETMAVMMVMGNANLFPRLLGKGESIAAVIALEMGTAVVGSPHYHALYAAGLVLMVLLCAINVTIGLIREKLTG